MDLPWLFVFGLACSLPFGFWITDWILICVGMTLVRPSQSSAGRMTVVASNTTWTLAAGPARDRTLDAGQTEDRTSDPTGVEQHAGLGDHALWCASPAGHAGSDRNGDVISGVLPSLHLRSRRADLSIFYRQATHVCLNYYHAFKSSLAHVALHMFSLSV